MAPSFDTHSFHRLVQVWVLKKQSSWIKDSGSTKPWKYMCTNCMCIQNLPLYSLHVLHRQAAQSLLNWSYHPHLYTHHKSTHTFSCACVYTYCRDVILSPGHCVHHWLAKCIVIIIYMVSKIVCIVVFFCVGHYSTCTCTFIVVLHVVILAVDW